MASVQLTGSVPQPSAPVAVGALSGVDKLMDTGSASVRSDTDVDTRLSADGQIQSALATLQDALATLAAPQVWEATRARSSAPDVVNAASAPGARTGPYTVQVTQLAQGQVSSFSSLSTPVALAVMHVESGKWDSARSTFATNPNWPKASITFGPKDTSMEEVRDRINAAGVGVLATVVSDATGTRLILRSTGTGSAQGFRVTAESPSGERISEQSPLDDAAVQALANGWGRVRMEQPAQDARVEIDGETLESPDGTVFQAQSGLYLRANQTTTAPVTVSVEADSSAIRDGVKNMVRAFNALKDQLDSPAAEAASRSRTENARAMLDDVANMVRAARQQASPSLADYGVTLDERGSMRVDASRLAQALSQDTEGLRALMQLDERADRELAAPAPTTSPTTNEGNPMTAPAMQRLLSQYRSDELANA